MALINENLNRRAVLRVAALAGAMALSACSAPAASPTVAPAAAPTSPPKPAAAPATVPATAASNAPAPTAPATPKPAAATTVAPAVKAFGRFRFAIPDLKFDSVFEAMGVEKGFFKEAGIDAELVPVAGGVEPIRGLVSGDFDFVEHGSTAMFTAIESNAPIQFVGTTFLKFPHQMYTKKDITDLKQLYGKPFGMSQPGDSFEAMPKATFAKRGLDVNQLNLIPVGSSVANFQALVAGKIDACTSALENMQLLDQNPSWDAKVFLAYGDELPNYMRSGGVVSSKAATERKDFLTAALTAWIRGIHYALDHKDEAVAWAVQKGGTKEEVARWAFDQYTRLGLVNVDFGMTNDAIAFTQDIHLNLGIQNSKIDPVKSLESSIQQAAIKAAGPYKKS